ncbi:MAG TPA: hypothetical protein VNT30_18980 [Stellaceae bacterium]|nr:hypothetical protein [Stellaceae bacterium]
MALYQPSTVSAEHTPQSTIWRALGRLAETFRANRGASVMVAYACCVIAIVIMRVLFPDLFNA